jgi:hypothetical protein
VSLEDGVVWGLLRFELLGLAWELEVLMRAVVLGFELGLKEISLVKVRSSSS